LLIRIGKDSVDNEHLLFVIEPSIFGRFPMDTNVWIVISAVLAGIVVILAAMLFTQRKRSAQLQERFGPEYDRVLRDRGSQKDAEEELLSRERRVTRFRIVPLSREDEAQFSEAWRAVQNRFVDDPKAAVDEADRQVRELMQRRGYPMGDFEQRAADLSVDHAEMVDHYRQAHQIAVRNQTGTASTEDLRKAIIHYRAMFDELLEVGRNKDRDREAHEKTGGLSQWKFGRDLFRRQI
jgi:FtsZ-interacting cell division protein ZipA